MQWQGFEPGWQDLEWEVKTRLGLDTLCFGASP